MVDVVDGVGLGMRLDDGEVEAGAGMAWGGVVGGVLGRDLEMRSVLGCWWG